MFPSGIGIGITASRAGHSVLGGGRSGVIGTCLAPASVVLKKIYTGIIISEAPTNG